MLDKRLNIVGIKKTMRKLEKKYEKTSEKAILDRARIEKKMAVLMAREQNLTNDTPKEKQIV